MKRTRLVLLLVFGMLATLSPAGAVGAADGVCDEPYTPIYDIQGDGFSSPLLPAPLQFLSYEGSFEATDGPADGMVSDDIGVSESGSTPVGYSLQLTGTGSSYGDFSWAAAAANTFGAPNNTGQTFSGSGDSPFINEIHYDNSSGDTGEAIEIAGPAGFDLAGWSIVLYNGSASQRRVYDTINLSGVIPDQDSGFGTLAFFEAGIQNGSPDGLALVTSALVTTQGVVTADFQMDEELGGFFVQDIEGDDNPSTSDGVFVFHRDWWGYDVSVGEVVRFSAEVQEQFGLTQLSFVDDLTVCGKGKVKSTKVELPLDNSGREAIEGMLVRFEEKLFVTDMYNLHRYGEVWVTQDGVAEQPTNEFGGGTPEMDALAASNMANSILLDDGSGETPPPHPTFFVKKDCYSRYGKFDLDFKIQSDFDLTMRFMALNKIKTQYLPGVMVKMRMGGVTNNRISNVIKGNYEAYRACKKNGLSVTPFFMVKKVLSRIPQFFRRPQHLS